MLRCGAWAAAGALLGALGLFGCSSSDEGGPSAQDAMDGALSFDGGIKDAAPPDAVGGRLDGSDGAAQDGLVGLDGLGGGGADTVCTWESDDPDCPGRRGVHDDWAELEALVPFGPEQTREVCLRPGRDLIRDLLCNGRTRINGLGDLLNALNLPPNSLDGVSGFSLAGHSTALAARSVSAINPRVIFSRLERQDVLGFIPALQQNPDASVPDGGLPDGVSSSLLFVGFTRGEQFVELIVRDNVDLALRFYVLAFRQACNDRPEGCLPGDLLTPAIESEWLETTLYDEVALQNTVMDCAPCHQQQGPGTPKQLIMHEFRAPWTHWHSLGTEGGRELMNDYLAAKGSEPLAGVSHRTMTEANPNSLAMVVFFTEFGVQGQEFDGITIEAEVKESARARGGNQPADNRVKGQSETWRSLYERAQRGEAITVPYHDVKVTDADKLAAMTRAYAAYRAGELPRRSLPDIRDVYPDDPERLAHMGVQTEPGLSGEQVLVEACSLCHNERLDQSLSRARFRADLVGMDRQAKDLAMERLMLPQDDPRVMPPARLRTLTPEARDRAIEALRQ